MKKIVLIILVTLGFYHLRGQEDTVDSKSIWELSMYDLSKIQVTVTTRTPVTVFDAPGFTSSYDNKLIERLGYYTIKDLSMITTGYGTTPSTFNEVGLETRGQGSSSFENDKHQILLDGVPINFARSYKAPIDNDLPLFFAQNVEFLRGPGSALYGIGAFSGVVNLHSKEIEEGDLFETKSRVRFPYNGQQTMSNAIIERKDFSAKLFFGFTRNDFSGNYLGDTTNNDFRYWDNQKSYFAYLSYKLKTGTLKGFSFNTVILDRKSGLGEFWWGPNSAFNQIEWTSIIPFFKYERELSSKTKLSSYFKHNRSTENGNFASLTANTSFFTGNQRFATQYQRYTVNPELMAMLEHKASLNTTIIGGINYDNKAAIGEPKSFDVLLNSPDTIDFKPKTEFYYLKEVNTAIHTISPFFQVQHKFNLLKGLQLTAGAREDIGMNGAFNYEQLSPRLGSVLKITDKLNFKLLYGRALRVPSPKNIGLNEEAKQQIIDLGADPSIVEDVQAETIDSYEAGISYTSRSLSINLIAFSNQTKNSLISQPLEINNERINMFSNNDSITSGKGFEIEATYTPEPWLLLHSNFSTSKIDYNGLSPNFYIPTSKWNSYAVLKIRNKIKTDITLSHHMVFDRVDGEIALGGYNRTDINARFFITKNLDFELMAQNILDVKYFDPGYFYSTDNIQLTIPKPGRTLFATLSFNFK